MAASGFHSNGYSLVRRVVGAAGLDLTATPAGLDRPLGEVLLEPTRVYALDCLALVARFGVEGVHAYAHITGGGLAGNTARVVPDGLAAVGGGGGAGGPGPRPAPLCLRGRRHRLGDRPGRPSRRSRQRPPALAAHGERDAQLISLGERRGRGSPRI
jgi:hypothetical protein